jgi:hypothetical protein
MLMAEYPKKLKSIKLTFKFGFIASVQLLKNGCSAFYFMNIYIADYQ